VKRDDSSEFSETFLPQTLDEEEAEDDDDYDTEEYEKQLLLRERLREYLLEEKLDAIRSQIADEGDDYDDVGDEWLRSRLSPAYANIYSGFMPALFSSCRQNVLEKNCPQSTGSRSDRPRYRDPHALDSALLAMLARS